MGTGRAVARAADPVTDLRRGVAFAARRGYGEVMRRRKVAFLVQAPFHWSCFRTVHAAFAADARWEVTLVAAPFLKHGDIIGEPSWDFLTRLGLPFVRHEAWDPARDRPDATLLCTPYDFSRPEALSAATLARLGHRLVYIPYGSEVGGGAPMVQFQYQLETHDLAWRNIAFSEFNRRCFERANPKAAKRVRVTGHPKFDAWATRPPRDPAQPRTVLWTPHFSVGFERHLRWSTFDRHLEAMLALTLRYPALRFILRPHPQLPWTLQHSPGGAALWDGVRAFAAASQNLAIDQSSSYVEAFHAADGLITDASSLMYEFMLLDKPMLYLHCEGGAGLNEAGLLMTQAIATARGEPDLARFVDEIARGADTRRDARNTAIRKLVGPLDGGAGARVKAMIDAELPA